MSSNKRKSDSNVCSVTRMKSMKLTSFFPPVTSGAEKAPHEFLTAIEDSIDTTTIEVASTSGNHISESITIMDSFTTKVPYNQPEKDETIKAIIDNRIPAKTYQYPSYTANESKAKNSTSLRKFNPKWLEENDWLAYSCETNGILCLCCRLFPTESQTIKGVNLIELPYKNWKEAPKILRHHADTSHHKKSYEKFLCFLQTYSKANTRIDFRLNEETSKTVNRNREIMRSIIKCVELCGRLGLPLRGHSDDGDLDEISPFSQGVFKSLLLFKADSDDSLKHHFETCAKNATYISKTSQNDFLDCITEYIQDVIVKEVKCQPIGHKFAIMADEVTDMSNHEQIGLAIRYLKDDKPVERLVSFVETISTRGEELYERIVKAITSLGLDPLDVRAQNYDGAANMSSMDKGVAGRFLKLNPRAPYLHCASHELNLVLVNASKCDSVKIMLCNFKAFTFWMNSSNKRNRALEAAINEYNESHESEQHISLTKVKTFCATRWVERHKAFDDFHVLYEPVMDMLTTMIGNRKEWGDVAGEASSHFNNLSSSSFLAAFETVRYLLGFTKSLSLMLQGESFDILLAQEEISLTLKVLERVRNDCDSVFESIFSEMERKACIYRSTISKPRWASKQTLRSNHQAATPLKYYQVLFIEYLDCLIMQLRTRFGDISKAAILGLTLLPSNLKQLDPSSLQKLLEYYTADLPYPECFSQELERWKLLWEGQENQPATIMDTLASSAVSQSRFPNIVMCLRLLLLMPVTSATVERANSALKHVKSAKRATMGEDRLNALVLLFIHKDIELDFDSIIDKYYRKKPRRMCLQNPLQDV